MLSGCIRDYYNSAKFIIDNNSSHKIRLTSESSERWRNNRVDVTVMPNESYKSDKIVEEAVGLENFIGEKVLVIFDDETEFVYMRKTYNGEFLENNICYDDCWNIHSTSKHSKEWLFSFTDEDYERAVAANAESGK